MNATRLDGWVGMEWDGMGWDGMGWDSESARENNFQLDLHVGGSDHSIVCTWWWWWLFLLLIAVLVSSLKENLCFWPSYILCAVFCKRLPRAPVAT
jgi:hypothetical protein